ncbi:hypothetical protein OX284_002760 [Flavobacterium sp. SUN046]|uniref:hypothetical protein n=1 Tax=Flavobacterium sp. SUN046 TaxID=3002440 RepID=UPI002DBDED01|nr:hypothetical protein [Flavobacterium sp. SUN046]MEC4048336.1 hypothetical protein [Flavobacterium sp. SUN046]
MKNLLFTSLIIVISFRITDLFLGIHLDFNVTLKGFLESFFNKITLISFFIFFFCYSFFLGVKTFLPNFFLNRTKDYSKEYIKRFIKLNAYTNNIINKIKFSENINKTSKYILEPYIFLIMFLLCFKINIIILIIMFIVIIMLISAGNIITLYSSNIKELQNKKQNNLFH